MAKRNVAAPNGPKRAVSANGTADRSGRGRTGPFTGALAVPTHLQRAYYRTVSDTLRNPSLALRRDPTLQRQMRNDPDIEAPLQDLKIAIVGLDWQLRPEEGDGDDKITETVGKLLNRIPQFPDLCGQLLESVWYGPAAANLIYGMHQDGLMGITSWLPMHPDTLVFAQDGNVGVRVGSKYVQDKGSEGVEAGFNSYIHYLTTDELYRVALMTYQRRGPDFEEPYEGAYAYGGRGMRDVAWYYWLLKQTVLQNWGAYAERFAMGIRVGYYPLGQENGKENMENVLRNLQGDVAATLPRSSPDQKDYEIDIMEPSASRATTFADLCRWLTSNIKELIVGQSATSEASAGGMGSNVASQHAKTFSRHTRYVAKCLEEAVTDQIVRRLVELNFGPDAPVPEFRYAVPDPDSSEWMKGVDAFIRAGGEVSEAEVRDRLGITKPKPGEGVLSLQTVDAAFGAAGGKALGGQQADLGRSGGKKDKPAEDKEVQNAARAAIDHFMAGGDAVDPA
jgi:phage gp29-like protein